MCEGLRGLKMSLRDVFSYVARQIFYDNSDSGLTAEDVKSGIDEVANLVNVSASPGFSFGRSSNVNANTWLQCETVPSNKSGRYVYISNATVTEVFVSNENQDTFDLEVYSNDKGGLGLVLLGTVNIVSSYGGAFSVNWTVVTGTELAIKLVNGSGKNIVAGLELAGTN